MSRAPLNLYHEAADMMGAPAPPPPANPQEKKRRRPALACEQCRRRKIRCDRNSPCGHCTKARIASCTYAPTHVPASKTKRPLPVYPAGLPQPQPVRPAGTADSRSIVPEAVKPAAVLPNLHVQPAPGGPGSRAGSGSGSGSESSNVDWLVARVHELEQKLANGVHISDEQDKASATGLGPTPPLTGTVSKTRYFGSSHWINVIELLPTEFGLLGRAEVEKTDVYQALVKCKALGRRIKENRHRPVSSENIGKQIPPRDVADQLIDNYLRTFEGVLRIVHVPTFRADYERYWQNPEAANDAFVMQMQLCLALGATLYDEYFTMRATAMQWIYEAQLWLMLPPEKGRMTIPSIQVTCLLVLAKSTCGVGQDLTWITTGALLRKAIYMGLHRDPKHLGKMTTFRAELRRRLWATILEFNLQCSFEAGGPPLLSKLDYDTQPPANIDDDQLGDETDGEGSLGEPPEVPTQTSVQLAILKSLTLRLDLVRNTNDFRGSQPYDEILRLNSELTKACRELSRTLSSLRSKAGGLARVRITTFHISMAEMFLYRCFHALHQTVIAKSFDDHRFYFSRRMCLDSALKLAHLWGLSGPYPASPEDGVADFQRLVVNGTGMFRYIPTQALFFIAVELIHQKRGQSSSLGYLPSLGDSDLRACLAAAQTWTIERVRAGETNGKGHCFAAAALGHVDALSAGLDEKQVDEAILRAATDSAIRCLQALREVAKREGLPADEAEHETAEVEGAADMQLDWMEDWAWDDTAGLSWPQWSQGTFDGMAPAVPGHFLDQ